MHFGERDYSKNGHRTIIFKNTDTKQQRIGLSKTDIRKIEIIYGPECQRRDRQAKIDICKNYPVLRKKREINITLGSLRVNRNITAPPENLTDELTQSINELGITNELQKLIEHVHKITAVALENARIKHCNNSKEKTDNNNENNAFNPTNDITKVIEVVKDYAESVIKKVETNLTAFCDSTDSIDIFHIGRCRGNENRCPGYYKSTKSDQMKYSTQYRPYIVRSTRHDGKGHKLQYDDHWLRTNNNSETRGKRDLTGVIDNQSTDKIDVANVTTSGNASKEVLRMGTTIISQNIVNFASLRRFGNRKHSLNRNKERQPEIGDESYVSLEKPKNSKKIEKNRPEFINVELNPQKLTINRQERYRERKEKERNIKDREEVIHLADGIVDTLGPKRQKIHKERKRTSVPETVELSKKNKEFYAERVWPDGIVRYVITEDSNYDLQGMRARLAEVNNILKKKTCVRIEEVSEREGQKYEDYLVLDGSADYVTGTVGGKQVSSNFLIQ
ncbi:unnamed protein product, partial [Brenthis ino]